MARFKIVLAFFAILSLLATVVLLAFIWQKFIVPQNKVEMKLSGASSNPKPDLGRKHYTKAISFIKEGELISARNELQYMLDIYSDSATLP